MPDYLAQYVDELLGRANLTNLPEDFKNEYRQKILESVQKRIGIIALKELDAKGIKEFEEMNQSEGELSQDELLTFFRARIPNFEQKMTQTLKEYADEFVEGAKRLRV